MRINIDLDGTLCTGNSFLDSTPVNGGKEFLKELKKRNATITLRTYRDADEVVRTPNGIMSLSDLTLQQLQEWEFEVDSISFNEPRSDIDISNKAVSLNEIFWNGWTAESQVDSLMPPGSDDEQE